MTTPQLDTTITLNPRSQVLTNLPQSLTATELSSLVNTNPTIPFINNVKNPLKRGFSPRMVTPATNHHVGSQASMFSLSNINQSDYSGLLNLSILVFVTITLRLILENLMKYGLLFRLGNFFSSSSTTFFTDPEQLIVLLTFLRWVIYIVIIAPLISWLIEVFATRKNLFLSNYITPSKEAIQTNTSVKDIQKRALIGSKIAFWLHTINISALFFLPLHYIFYTPILPLLLRFPIAFMCVVTTLKLFSYVHTSTSIRTSTGQCIAFDTSLGNNYIDSLSNSSSNNNKDKNIKVKDNEVKLTTTPPPTTTSTTSSPQSQSTKSQQAQLQQQQRDEQQLIAFADMTSTTINTKPVTLTSINPSTAMIFPHQGKQTILQMQFDVYNAMALQYFTQMKLLLHTITMSYTSFTPDELWTNIDEKYQNSRSKHSRPLAKLVDFILSPLYFISSLFFGRDKKNRIYGIITRGFGLIHTNHTFNYELSYEGQKNNNKDDNNMNDEQHCGKTPTINDDSFNSTTSTSGSMNSGDFSLFSAKDFDFNTEDLFDELFDQNTKSTHPGVNSPSSYSSTVKKKQLRSTQVTIHIENHFNQKQTNILHFSKPNFALDQKIDPNNDHKNIPASSLVNSTSQQPPQPKQPQQSKIDHKSTTNIIHPITVTYSKSSLTPSHCHVDIQNLPSYPQTLPRYTIFDYAPCLSQLLYFLICPTLIYQISYPRSSRIKLHFIFRRLIELLSIGVLLLFFIEQFVRPTLLNSLHYFMSIDQANLILKEKLRLELNAHIAQIPNIMNNTFSLIESGVNSTLSTLISEGISTKLLESTNVIANSIVDSATTTLPSAVSSTSIHGTEQGFAIVITTLLQSMLGIIERTLKLSLPNVIIWLLIFYGLFHSYLNLVAEIAQFGDRCFYLEWWNSRDLGEYWNTWNQPVYQYFGRHLFSVMVGLKMNTNVAKLCVFLISAILHEVLIAVPMQIVAFHAFFGMLLQAPLVMITVALHKKHNNPVIGNIIFWVSFVILGQPSLILMYFYQYLTTHGLITTAITSPTVSSRVAAAVSQVLANSTISNGSP